MIIIEEDAETERVIIEFLVDKEYKFKQYELFIESEYEGD